MVLQLRPCTRLLGFVQFSIDTVASAFVGSGRSYNKYIGLWRYGPVLVKHLEQPAFKS